MKKVPNTSCQLFTQQFAELKNSLQEIENVVAGFVARPSDEEKKKIEKLLEDADANLEELKDKFHEKVGKVVTRWLEGFSDVGLKINAGQLFTIEENGMVVLQTHSLHYEKNKKNYWPSLIREVQGDVHFGKVPISSLKNTESLSTLSLPEYVKIFEAPKLKSVKLINGTGSAAEKLLLPLLTEAETMYLDNIKVVLAPEVKKLIRLDLRGVGKADFTKLEIITEGLMAEDVKEANFPALSEIGQLGSTAIRIKNCNLFIANALRVMRGGVEIENVTKLEMDGLEEFAGNGDFHLINIFNTVFWSLRKIGGSTFLHLSVPQSKPLPSDWFVKTFPVLESLSESSSWAIEMIEVNSEELWQQILNRPGLRHNDHITISKKID